jgi:hypothetical protein
MIQSIMKINTIKLTPPHYKAQKPIHKRPFKKNTTCLSLTLIFPSPPREAFIPSSMPVNNTIHVLDASVTQSITKIGTMIHLPSEQYSATSSAYPTYISGV